VRLYLEKPFTQKRAGGVAESVGPEFKPQTTYSHKHTKEDRFPRMLLEETLLCVLGLEHSGLALMFEGV
jgi:hypothetical protein